ncbi:hypothetical protein AGABI1DRAFT_127971 [Agaricus bisporus var. burnettii JB137-S8]|uniref:C2H2-type domain-containing protein n=1 Tax=Agaricus bisporus var. burnettii (strain JB137-S8 / ATCC MYA-4627 / FGSC 10392) TaxID=597362 RepID=K5XY80_AGABU|nr:uncharacterized protein AGABI1DRAFT_127971 [Agaricus bisporus var. burnettii JB137-S8]EKM80295.1 hypothetical protein AGABI1DRAFT_127971 [Agaricus bisporus var. burnettii JB137-S8]
MRLNTQSLFKTENSDSRLSLSPSPMREHTSDAIRLTSLSFLKDTLSTRIHRMEPSSRSSSPGSSYDSLLPKVGRRFPSVSCCSSVEYGSGFSDATQCPTSVDLPPLKLEPGGSRRNSPQSFCSEGYETASSYDIDDEDSGLPEVLNKFKLIRPRIPAPESDVSCYSTPSPHSLFGLLPDEKQVSQCDLTVPPPQRSMSRNTASEGRRISRRARRSPSPVVHDLVHSAALKKALNGAPLSEITVPQLRMLIRKHPVPTHLNGKWEDYTVYDPSLDGKKDHRCTFDSCSYSGKKQLVQRHIEGVHLKMKQYHCPYCDAAFHQETCAVTHISSIHLRIFPFRCKYECDKRFNDVARRHRHYQEAHGYVSKQTKRAPREGRQLTGNPDTA